MQESSDRSPARWLTLAGLSAAAFAAHAGDFAVTGANGAMTFPNVQVVTAPAPVASKPAAAQGGMRAFVDPATGKLVSPSAEQAAALEAAEPARPAATSRMRSQASAPTEIYPAQGGVGITLNDSYMSYSVARKDAGGKVATDCVPGSELSRWSSKKSSARHAHMAAPAGDRK